MLLADALPCCAPQNGPEVALDIAIYHVHITPEKKLEFQRSIQDEPLLYTLDETIVAGWPENVSDVPNTLRPYHQYSNEMTVEDGLISKGEALIIPPAEREKIPNTIHEGHQGISTTLHLLARHQPRHQMYGRIICNMSMTLTTRTMAATQTNTGTRKAMAVHQH